MIRAEVVYTGRVQGVYFRGTAQAIARDHRVAGWVRNEPDGSVRLVVEGETTEVDRFLAAIRDAKRACIADEREERLPATRELSGFSIRR